MINVKRVNYDTRSGLPCSRSSKRATAAGILAVALLSALLASTSARAAFVTTQAAGVNAIYSQASFGTTPVSIQFLPTVTLVAPDLLDITTNLEVQTLFGMGPADSPTVNWFYIDTISACGGSSDPNIAGCGQTPGNNFVVESDIAAAGVGAALLGHELGHNLNLPHINDPNNLMNAILFGNTDLTVGQVNTILSSPLVQTDGGGNKFIQIQTVLVTAVVPIPAALPLMFSALALLGAAGLRRRRAA